MTHPNFTVHKGYKPDPENLASPVVERAAAFLGEYPTSLIYLNPICTIVADEPSQAFFTAVMKWQSQWCQQASSFIGRSSRRKVRDYISDRGRMSKRNRFYERAFSFTGILYHEGRDIPPHRWKELETK
ncbi:hypothetical protein [Rhodopirellula bahusiensis]|uniref:hypothetical protein n=1 Tax=Rhodopirellula bahusiensis TaxID=2014065 RepID=UPI00117B73B6|nr:hypothetical protein [Rhodopirellula bahusiensis]